MHSWSKEFSSLAEQGIRDALWLTPQDDLAERENRWES